MRCAELYIHAESGSTVMGNDKDQKQNQESLFENLEEQQVSRRQSRRRRVKAESAEDAGRGDGMQNRRLRSSDRQAAAVILLLVFAAGILAGILGTKIAGKKIRLSSPRSLPSRSALRVSGSISAKEGAFWRLCAGTTRRILSFMTRTNTGSVHWTVP